MYSQLEPDDKLARTVLVIKQTMAIQKLDCMHHRLELASSGLSTSPHLLEL